MGNKSQKQSLNEINSNSSILNLPLESNKESSPDSLKIHNNNNDLIKELKNEVELPIENEYIESSEFLLEGKEEELKIKNFFENNENFSDEGVFKKRSKTFVPKILINNTPRPHPKELYGYISPLKLSIKSYGNIRWNKKSNAVLYDFQKNMIDCKSCNDEDICDDFFLLNSENDTTTPSIEDLNDLLNCRKKMTIFRNSINDRIIKEYENILNSDYLFVDDEETNININNHQSKKNNFWCKHIKQQLLKDKNKALLHTKRIGSVPLVKMFESSCEEEEEDKKDHGLFILGILESAANERKKRNNTVVLNSDYNQL